MTDQAQPSATEDLAPVVEGAPVVKQTERPHPLTPFIRGWILFVAILIGLSQQFIPDGRSGNGFDASDLRFIVPVAAGGVLLAALAGFVSWYYTRFVIDDDELRVETGALFKNSKKVPFERLQSVDIIQPLAARIFGLAELRLEAGAGDSTIRLRYLSRTKAARLRDYLLTRAHGEQASIHEADSAQVADAFTDTTSGDHTLVKVTPQQLVGSFLLSSQWLVTVLMLVIVLVVTIQLEVVAVAFGAIIPLAIGTVSMIGRRVVAMYNFTLAESRRGLRVTRGLTNLTSQSVPINRIQGVRIGQSLLWRLPGWYRVDVDILGYGADTGENNEAGATSVLLPVAPMDDVRTALSRVLPGVDLDSIQMHPSPRRVWWVRWFDFWTLAYGWNELVMITSHGWLDHQRNVMPHAKTQSVRIEQGPLQRRLRLADVHIDTTRGPVNVVARQLDSQAARHLALTQLDRARAARAEAELRASSAAPSPGRSVPGEHEILLHFNIGEDQLLGEGGESRVFALNDASVLRIYHEPSRQVADQLSWLYGFWESAPTRVQLPKVLQVDEMFGRTFSIDRRMHGQPMSPWLAAAPTAERRQVLASYLDAAWSLPQLPSPVPGFARLVGAGAPQQFATLPELLTYQLQHALVPSRAKLEVDLENIADIWHRWQADISGRESWPQLVHGDFCPTNAYVGEDYAGQFRVTGLGDFSPHTLNADPLMDVAGAVCLLEIERYDEAIDDAAWLEAVAADRLGPEIRHWIGVYRRFYGFYFASDPQAYPWCLAQLSR